MVDDLFKVVPYNIWKLEPIVSSCKLLKEGKLSKREEVQLHRWINEVVRDLARQIITSKHEPMTADEVDEALLNIRHDVLSSARYLDAINKVVGDNTAPQQFVRDLLSICQRSQKGNSEEALSRLLSRDRNLFKTDDGLFWSRSWPLKEVFQICVQLASKCRTKDKRRLKFYKDKAIYLLESRIVDFPDKDSLIQTLRRL